MSGSAIDTTHEAMMANAIRALSMDAVEAANSGHPGMPMGMADATTVLFNRFMRIDPTQPLWADRDRFVLSAGHGSMLLYAVHNLLGYDDMPMDEIRNFRKLGSRTAGHPEYGHAAGIETTTGPLGQGIATAVGMALAERMLNARFGDDLVDHRTFAIAGDGCLMEGISHEAIDLAGHLGLGGLIVLWDDNRITIDGATDLSTSLDQQQRFAAAGWHVISVDGHDREAVGRALAESCGDQRPSLIACRTIIGFGAPTKQGTSATHGSPLGADEIAATRQALGWNHPAFEVPADVADAWLAISKRGSETRQEWQERLDNSEQKNAFLMHYSRDNAPLLAAMEAYRRELLETRPKLATRKASERALEVINAVLPDTVGGSADLTGSNNTRTKAMRPVSRDDFSGSYIHYGIREHGMAAAMNGISLHGGLRPYGGTFLAFSDYCRGAIRLSALMRQPVVYVMTHDSIGLGEDGPTHQPVEQVASLRAMPNINVFRPADALETAEAWECALTNAETPSILCLSRQDLPFLRDAADSQNQSARGAYLLSDPGRNRDLTLIATGSEVSIAVEAAERLASDGLAVAVVSAPCFDIFAQQDAEYRAAILGSAPRIGIEAGVSFGWAEWLGSEAAFVGMTSFGASGPAAELYRYFGITVDRVVVEGQRLIKERLEKEA